MCQIPSKARRSMMRIICFGLGAFFALAVASADQCTDGWCNKKGSNCSGLTSRAHTSCPYDEEEEDYSYCSWEFAGGTYVTCNGTADQCCIITPYVKQDCDGACVVDPIYSCTQTFNKCH